MLFLRLFFSVVAAAFFCSTQLIVIAKGLAYIKLTFPRRERSEEVKKTLSCCGEQREREREREIVSVSTYIEDTFKSIRVFDEWERLCCAVLCHVMLFVWACACVYNFLSTVLLFIDFSTFFPPPSSTNTYLSPRLYGIYVSLAAAFSISRTLHHTSEIAHSRVIFLVLPHAFALSHFRTTLIFCLHFIFSTWLWNWQYTHICCVLCFVVCVYACSGTHTMFLCMHSIVMRYIQDGFLSWLPLLSSWWYALNVCEWVEWKHPSNHPSTHANVHRNVCSHTCNVFHIKRDF